MISGKGGTGKTTIVGAFSRLAEDAVFADCDVDAPDLWILLDPKIEEQRPFYGGQKPRVIEDLCTGCNECGTHCRFGAIRAGRVDLVECEGCGFCEAVCPEKAIQMTEHLNGHLYIATTPYGPFVFARLNPGEENSGKLVTEVKKEARSIVEQKGARWLIIDGPPGIGCPVMAALNRVNLALLVTEPSIAGLSDLERAVDLCRFFRVPCCVVMNKADLNPSMAKKIEEFCELKEIPFIGRIPFDTKIPHLLSEKKTPIEGPKEVRDSFVKLWDDLMTRLT